MLKSLKIENFRCFQFFELPQLGRVNLLVGTNNSGKTSILEAIQLLASRGKLSALSELMINRGEYFLSEKVREGRELDIRHLFYGHEINVDSKFSIFGCNSNQNVSIEISVQKSSQTTLFSQEGEFVLAIKFLSNSKEQESDTLLPLSYNKGIPINYTQSFSNDLKKLEIKTEFVTSSSLTTEKMVELFDRVVLQPEEYLITEALQTIEPKIERIASVSSERYIYSGSRSGFVVRLADSSQRIPIGSMGDGIWRMLGLALAIVNAKDGILLVDEIDSGLHFSTMSDMWKMIWETAKKLNVQVFATTHSSDCWKSLDAIANSEKPSEDGITIQRIERDKSSSVVFNERQIAIAAERGIEVR
ncbi:MAG TPA: AAA family ATPase [Leptolyngbyaceae cyanobacterium]